MKTCPHCDASLPNLAEQCPQCRQYVAERRPGDGVAPASWPGVVQDPTPSAAGYLGLGALVWIVGVAIMLAGSDEESSATPQIIGAAIALIGVLIVLVGVIALGVYVGLRQHTDWQERRGS